MAWQGEKEIQIAKLKKEIELLKGQLAVSEVKAKTYEEDFQWERLDRERAQGQRVEMEERVEELLRMQLLASGEHGIPVAAAAMFQQRPARDEDAIRQSERKIGRLEEQIRTQQEVVKLLQHRLKDFEENKPRELEDLRDQLAALSAEKDQLATENRRLQGNNDQLWNTVSRQEAHNTELKNIVHGSPDLRHQLDESNRQRTCLMTQLHGSRMTSAELEQRCQNLGQKVDDKEYEKRSLQRELSDLMSRHQDLQEELARMMAERNKEEADHRQEKEDLMERLRDAAREKHELEIRLEQVSPMASHRRTTDICQQMEQLEFANHELSDQVATLTTENDHLRHQQETVQMKVYSRLQETGESLRHQRSEGFEKLENDVKAIWDILRDLRLTGDRRTRDDTRRGSQSSYLPTNDSSRGNMYRPPDYHQLSPAPSPRPVPKPRR